jgi:hypothetical protein
MAISSCRPYAKQDPAQVLAAAQNSRLLAKARDSRMAPDKYFAALSKQRFFEIGTTGIELVQILHQRAQVIADKSGLFKNRDPWGDEIVDRVTGETNVDEATKVLRTDKLIISPDGCDSSFKLLMISTMRKLDPWKSRVRTKLLGACDGEVYQVQEVFMQKHHPEGMVVLQVVGQTSGGSLQCSMLGEMWSEPEFFFSRAKNPVEIQDFQSLLYTWQSIHALSFGLTYPMSGLSRFAKK